MRGKWLLQSSRVTYISRTLAAFVRASLERNTLRFVPFLWRKQTNTRRCFALEQVSPCTVEPWKKVSLYMYCKSVIGDRTVQTNRLTSDWHFRGVHLWARLTSIDDDCTVHPFKKLCGLVDEIELGAADGRVTVHWYSGITMNYIFTVHC